MIKLIGKTRKYLRGLAHHLDPAVIIGKNGVTSGVLNSISNTLDAHELIKVKFRDNKDEKKRISKKIEEITKCVNVGIIGNIAIFYKENPDIDKRKIFFPK